MTPPENHPTVSERSSQRDLEDDEPSSSPADVDTPTVNDSAEPNHTNPSTVQFHKANKEAVPPSRTDRFFQGLYAVMPRIPVSLQEGHATINPDLHRHNLATPAGQARKEAPKYLPYYVSGRRSGEGMLSRALSSLPSMPSGLPSIPSLPSLPYFAGDGRRPRRLSGRSYATVLEPFESVDHPLSESDDNVSTIVSAEVLGISAPPSDGNPDPKSSSRDGNVYICVHEPIEVDTDPTYEARRQQHEEESAQRQQRWDAIRQVGETAVTMAKTSAEVALVGAQVGAAVMTTNTRDLVTDVVRELRVRGARKRLVGNHQGDEDDASQASTASEYLDELGDSEDDDFVEASEDAGTDATNSFKQKATSPPPQNNGETSPYSADSAKFNNTFEDIDLDGDDEAEPVGLDDDFDVITQEEAGRPHWAVTEVGPHTRRPLHDTRHRRRPGISALPGISARPPARSPAFQRPPSPSTINIAMISERPDELPHRRRVDSNGDEQNN
ncbi:hypothetical protein BFW01_g2312 [Lasiodiplodia theobromae]|nr:hypothetical protein BFW01_g2312 [Lasiodiplodia theobromae]